MIRHPVCQFKAIFLPTCGGFVPFHLEIYVSLYLPQSDRDLFRKVIFFLTKVKIYIWVVIWAKTFKWVRQTIIVLWVTPRVFVSECVMFTYWVIVDKYTEKSFSLEKNVKNMKNIKKYQLNFMSLQQNQGHTTLWSVIAVQKLYE